MSSTTQRHKRRRQAMYGMLPLSSAGAVGSPVHATVSVPPTVKRLRDGSRPRSLLDVLGKSTSASAASSTVATRRRRKPGGTKPKKEIEGKLEDISECKYLEVIRMDEEIDVAEATGFDCFQPDWYPKNYKAPTDYGASSWIAQLTKEQLETYTKYVVVSETEAEEISQHRQGGAEWLKNRPKRFGASETGPPLDLCDYNTMEEGLAYKFGPPRTRTAGMARGSVNEDQGVKLLVRDLNERALQQLHRVLNEWFETHATTTNSDLVDQEYDKMKAPDDPPIFRFFGFQYPVPMRIIRKWQTDSLCAEDCISRRPSRGTLVLLCMPGMAASGDAELELFGVYALCMVEAKWGTNNEPYRVCKRPHYTQMQQTLRIHNYGLMLYASFSARCYTISPMWFDQQCLDRFIGPAITANYFKYALPKLDECVRKPPPPPLMSTAASSLSDPTTTKAAAATTIIGDSPNAAFTSIFQQLSQRLYPTFSWSTSGGSGGGNSSSSVAPVSSADEEGPPPLESATV